MSEKRRAKIIVLSLAACLGIAAIRAFYAEKPRAQMSQAAPDFQLSDLGGRTVSLSDYKGKVVLLNFWASWCESCITELPVLNALYQRERGPHFELLAPSVDVGGRKAAMLFVARYSPSFPVLLSDSRTRAAYGVRELPASYLIDPQGRVARRYIGPLDPRVLENDILQLKSSVKKS